MEKFQNMEIQAHLADNKDRILCDQYTVFAYTSGPFQMFRGVIWNKINFNVNSERRN